MSQAPILLALTVMSIHYKFTISKNSQFSKKNRDVFIMKTLLIMDRIETIQKVS